VWNRIAVSTHLIFEGWSFFQYIHTDNPCLYHYGANDMVSAKRFIQKRNQLGENLFFLEHMLSD
jgi:hypothetical protein